MERGGIKHGLLSYALVDEGLEQELAARNGRILMSEWLKYAVQEVPRLFREGEKKGVVQVKGGPEIDRDIYTDKKKTPLFSQQPVLFDFARGRSEVIVAITSK